MKKQWPIWRQIIIPAHQGDLMGIVEHDENYIDDWAYDVFEARPSIRPRLRTKRFKVGRISATQLGVKANSLVSIQQIKRRGLAQGLRLLNEEKILALRLAYSDQPSEWMRVAVRTFVDKDGSWLDLAIVNDGSRKDIRTTWAFPRNQFQAEHEWFWEIP